MPEGTRRPDIGVIDTGVGLEGIGRLRYDLFVERDGKGYECADQNARMFLEPIDEVSLNFHHSLVVETLAAVRLSWASDALGDSHLRHVVRHSGIPDGLLSRATVTSRLAVRNVRAAKLRMLPMLRETCFAGILSGARFTIVSCRPSLIDLFIRLGFRSSGRPVTDTVAGLLEVMVLDLEDNAHLAAANSPFVPDVAELRNLTLEGKLR